MEKSKNTSRRKFLEKSAAIGALGAVGISQIMQSCSKAGTGYEPIAKPTLLDQAPDGQPLRAGVVGCGGRGTGAALNFLNAGPNLSIAAVADAFQDRIDSFVTRLSSMEGGPDLSSIPTFTGLDSYKRLLDEADVDLIITATPPYFRPEVVEAAINAGKHVFMEKPACVDPVGARRIIAASKQAEAAGLSVVTGTQRRSGRDYTDIHSHVAGGAIGDIVSLNVYWNTGKLWHYMPRPEWSDMEDMLRNWVSWAWLSGDHIVEQHVHQLDVANWFAGKQPVKAVGVGSRQRRVTGDQFDNFSIDFVYDQEVHMHSMCRQINDCANNVSEFVRGTKGYTNCSDKIWHPDGSIMYEHEYDETTTDDRGRTRSRDLVEHMDQEHIVLVTAIRNNEPIVQAEETAKSTLTAIMGRTAAYTGREITWEEMMASDEKLGPDVVELGDSDFEAVIPASGTAVDPVASDRGA